MWTRRQFLKTAAATTAAPLATLYSAETPAPRRRRLALITTTWWEPSHSWHMAERFLAGFPRDGRWHTPDFQLVSAYVDQFPEKDLSRQRAADFNFDIYPSIATALRCGGDELAVDGVLLIGEHGDYPINEYGQKQYPRYEFFRAITQVFREEGRAVPVFNDKHLSWNFDWAREMVETSRELDFPLLAGSSLPVTFRMPSIEMPWQAPVVELMGLAYGPVDIYDFHALEMMQCMAERRAGGETGVASIQALRGQAVWDAMAAGSWTAGGWNPRLFEACLSRSHTLAQAPTNSHRYPTTEQIQAWVKAPVAYRFEYRDGTRATMLQLNGLVKDFTFAAQLRGESQPLSTLFHLPPTPNVYYSAGLMAKAEEMFVTGQAPYPVERTLLTSGIVESALHSLAGGQQAIETPQLGIEYTPSHESHFLGHGAT